MAPPPPPPPPPPSHQQQRQHHHHHHHHNHHQHHHQHHHHHPHHHLHLHQHIIMSNVTIPVSLASCAVTINTTLFPKLRLLVRNLFFHILIIHLHHRHLHHDCQSLCSRSSICSCCCCYCCCCCCYCCCCYSHCCCCGCVLLCLLLSHSPPAVRCGCSPEHSLSKTWQNHLFAISATAKLCRSLSRVSARLQK